MLDYAPPSWIIKSSKLADITLADDDTKSTWNLDEIKAGVIVCEHNLHAVPLILFGRVLPDIPLPGENTHFIITAHESCSRLHARIAFDQSGSPWLRDLGSNNGTFVNKKQLPPKSIGRHENGTGEGSRGVRLYPGDMIQFGASTRCFILEGPSKYQRSKPNTSVIISNNPMLGESVIQTGKTSSTVAVEKPDDGVSWGMDMNDMDQERAIQDDDMDLALMDSSTIPEKYRKLYEKINEKKHKLSNISVETERIQRKVTLSDGQVAQITKNQNKEQELLHEIQKLELDLVSKLKGEKYSKDAPINGSNTRKRSRTHKDFDIEDEDSAFFDRTRKVSSDAGKDVDSEVVVETEKSLLDKWDKLYSLYERRRRDKERLLKNVQEVEKEMEEYSMKNSPDRCDEDLFFMNNDLSIAKDRWKYAMEAERNIETELSSIASMLHVIDKGYICDKSTGFVGRLSGQQSSSSSSTNNNKETDKDTLRSHDYENTPEINELKAKVIRETRVDALLPTMSALPTMCNQFDHSYEEPSHSSSDATVINQSPKHISNQGLLSFISLHHNKESKAFSKSHQTKNHPLTMNADTEKDSDTDLHNVWIAPEDQDGTGFTKLNEKYNGRY